MQCLQGSKPHISLLTYKLVLIFLRTFCPYFMDKALYLLWYSALFYIWINTLFGPSKTSWG